MENNYIDWEISNKTFWDKIEGSIDGKVKFEIRRVGGLVMLMYIKNNKSITLGLPTIECEIISSVTYNVKNDELLDKLKHEATVYIRKIKIENLDV